ncbi:MAG: transposase [Bacteroidales bacterium]|jgi:putative transposase|nr:transposase [Bacteroidales bacterium]
MDAKLVTERYRASQWMEILRDRKESSLSVDEYCREKGISRHAYYYWQRKLRNAACTELAKQDKMSAPIPTGWLQLSSTASAGASIKVEVSGCHIDVDGNTDLGLLKEVCRALRAL